MTASDVADDLWARLEPELDPPEVTMTGPRAILPSVFRVSEFATACVATATRAATALLEARGAKRRTPLVDSVGAALVFQSERHLRADGATFDLWDEVSGYYRTRDGRWVQLHCNFPHHRAGVVTFLGCDDSREAVAATIERDWDADPLETRLAEAGMCCTMLRSRDQWLDHAQGRAVAALPLLEIDRLGDAPARTRSGDRPLEGVRVLDLTRIIAGPVCGRVLAQHGAQVLRIGADHLPTVESCVADTGFGKRSTHLDLRDDLDRESFFLLLSTADVLVDGYRPGALDALGLTRDVLLALAPGLVHVSLSAFGHEGPWHRRRGFDSLTQTASGIGAAGATAQGVEGTRPLPCQALDHGTGWLLAAAAMSALRHQSDEGGSWAVRGSLAQTGHFLAELGQVDDLAVEPPPPEVLDLHTMTTESAFGTLSHIAAQGHVGGRSGYDLPPSPVGTHPPAWW